MAISYKIVSQVTIDLTEEDLKQIIIDKIKYDNPNIEIEEINFSGSRKKGQNINIDIKATLAGSERPVPAVNPALTAKKDEPVKEEKKEEQVDIEDLIREVEDKTEPETTRADEEMSLIDEVLAEETEAIEAEVKQDEVTLTGGTKSLAELLS